jgi:hypothetical protein
MALGSGPARRSDRRRGAGEATALRVFGRADNALTLLDRFDTVLLLDVDPSVAAERIRDPRRGNDFGRVGDTLQNAANAAGAFRRVWLDAGAVPVDANRPVDEVGQQLLLEAGNAVLKLRRRCEPALAHKFDKLGTWVQQPRPRPASGPAGLRWRRAPPRRRHASAECLRPPT